MNQSILSEPEYISKNEFIKNAKEFYTEKYIKLLISFFEDKYILNFSDDVYSDLDLLSKTQDYQDAALEIKRSIEIYEISNNKTFHLNEEKLNNVVSNEVIETSERVLTLVSLNDEYIKSDKKVNLTLVIDNDKKDNSSKIPIANLNIDNMSATTLEILRKNG
jgi:hypothetical protein